VYQRFFLLRYVLKTGNKEVEMEFEGQYRQPVILDYFFFLKGCPLKKTGRIRHKQVSEKNRVQGLKALK
jgi:hypothetical protein